MKRSLVTLVFLANAAFPPGTALAEIQKVPVPAEEYFSTRGSVTRTDTAQKTVYVKTEGGLELTFHVGETTQILVGPEAKSFGDLAPEDEIEIDYDYNQDFEKIARFIRKKSQPASS